MELDVCACGYGHRAAIVCVNRSGEKGGFEQQNKLMEAEGT